MAKIIAIANQKGGCTKTNVTVNLGIGLAGQGYKVALVDNDAQGSLTASLGYVEPDDINVTIANIMMNVINDDENEPAYGILHHNDTGEYRIVWTGSLSDKCDQPGNNYEELSGYDTRTV